MKSSVFGFGTLSLPKAYFSCVVNRAKQPDLTKPFNIASYALLTMMIAQVTGLEVGDFIHTLGDAHLYSNHLEQVDTQLARTPHPLPTMTLNPDVTSIFDFSYDDFEVHNYECDGLIRAPIAI